jgi:TldD protein
VGHGLESDLIQKEASRYAGRLGEQVASRLITVVDDATLPGRNGSYGVDDEGTPGQRTVLIDRGVLKSYLYDRLRSDKDGRSSTGNGRRESYAFQPIPRMSNTYIASGSDDPADIIRGVRKGLLATRMGGGQVNTVNGDFVFEVSEGYLIENGEVTTPVRGANLIGNGPEVLMAIDRIGSDLEFGMGTCGKDGQGVPVGDAQPTLHIPEITVGGTA